VGLEQSMVLFQGQVFQLGKYDDARVVDPGIEAAELRYGYIDDAGHVLRVADIGHGIGRLPTLLSDVLTNPLQDVLIARCQNHPGSCLGCTTSCSQANAGRGAGDDDGLLIQRLIAVIVHAMFSWSASSSA